MNELNINIKFPKLNYTNVNSLNKYFIVLINILVINGVIHILFTN